MKYLCLIMLLASSYSFSEENKLDHTEQLSNSMFHYVKLQYMKEAKLLVEKYNQNRNLDSEFIQTRLQKFGYTFQYKFKPITLPKMIIKHSGVEIPQIGFRYDLHSYLKGYFYLDDKKVVMNCKNMQECFDHVISTLAAPKASFINQIIDSAYASEDEVRNLLNKNYMLLGAMLLTDRTMEELPTFGGLMTSSAEIRARVVRNLEKLYTRIAEQNKECQNWREMAQDGYATSGTTIKEFNPYSMGNNLYKMVEYEDFSDMKGDLEDYLGSNVMSYTDIKGKSLIHHTDWKSYLSCESIPTISEMNKQNAIINVQNGQYTNIAGVSLNAPFNKRAVVPTQETKEYCEQFHELKECIIEYYNTAKSIANDERNGTKENQKDIRKFEENLEDSSEIQPE